MFRCGCLTAGKAFYPSFDVTRDVMLLVGLLPLHVISTKAIQGTSWVLPFFFIFACIAIFYFPMDAVGPYWLWDCLALIPYEQSSCGHTGFEFLTCLVECWFCCFRIFLWNQLNREKKVVKNDYSWYSLETI